MLQEIADNGIKIYQFPDAQLDEEDDAANQKMKVRTIFDKLSMYMYLSLMRVILFQEAIPFAVVGSNTVLQVAEKKIRGRQYPWGVAEGRCPGTV